ncbi:SDR family oxidoreductase [Microbacterium sp. 13-71-7]|jgi:NAD(P)-dependent dehydrogenase (short-subunit alcohol dehydrogenase family)|uniref:SDR family NAD(P)-dependent oxidoreductase n=1 Tax=Microbacterium sp. 13-71-7 TaxID=1970399 RepID=UPI000BDD6DBD|nr:SDR family oxidoreductase [Microbacterium sp. 13-71-7]OZB83158.1 MAG: short-chain dehydrogenase [Microbacterium sp. 13-71-7]
MVWPEGEAAFVTGAASGIGLGIAKALVAAGAGVALADLDAARLGDVVQELRDAGGTVIGIPLDVSDPDQWTSAADRAEAAIGPISILCYNAGVIGGGDLDETPMKVWRWVHSINVDAQLLGIQTFVPRFKSRGGRAHVVNTASMAGLLPIPHIGSYVSSKFASVGLTMVLRAELAGTGIGVSLLCPGSVATRITLSAAEQEAKKFDTEMNPHAAANDAMLSHGADPDKVGEQVVEAIQDRDFLIFTHREWAPAVASMQQEILAALEGFDGRHGPDAAAQAPAGDLAR